MIKVEENTDGNKYATREFWDYKQEATESKIKELSDSTHTDVVSKNMNNATIIKSKCKVVQGIH